MTRLVHSHYLIAFFVTLGVAIGLLITSFLLPPQGEINPSVLRAVAELCFWPALAFIAKALQDGKSARLVHGNTSVSIGDDNPETPVDSPMDEHQEDYEDNE